jgi:hypothetical protein
MDGYQILAFSEDGGRSYEPVKSPFPAIKGKQRPAGIRLASGRLFFASDFQMNFWGVQPPAIAEKYGKGSYVALSDDDGASWHIKQLPDALRMEIHDQPKPLQEHPFADDTHHGTALGYTIAAQSPNGMIHLISSFNHPNEHYEMNEAWILSDAGVVEMEPAKPIEIDSEPPKGGTPNPDSQGTAEVRCSGFSLPPCEECFPDGSLKSRWHQTTGSDGRHYLHGPEEHFFEDGSPHYRAEWAMGRKTGEERFWSKAGHVRWEREWLPDGRHRWTQYWGNGAKKAESFWRDKVADGPARTWDTKGRLIREVHFTEGVPEEHLPEPLHLPGFPKF